MAFRKKGFTAKQSRRRSRQMSESMLGTHVQRGSHTRRAPNASSVAFSDARTASRASRSQVHAVAPSTSSAEGHAAYRQRVGQRQYVENIRHRVRVRRIAVGIAVVLAIAAVAVGAGFLAFRGSVGSGMALRNSDAADALVPVKSGEASYTLITAELGAVADPLEGEGPDLVLLARADREGGSFALVNIPASLQVTTENGTTRLADLADVGDAALISAAAAFAKVDVSHYVKVGPGGVSAIADALDGVSVDVSQVIDDPHAGDVYIPQGTYDLKGEGALTYLRATNLKMGVEDQLANQVDFSARLLSKLFSAEGPVAQRIEAIAPYFQTDLSLADVEALAGWLKDVPADSIVQAALPGYMTTTAGVVDRGDSRFIGTSDDMAAIIAGLEGAEQPSREDGSSQAAAVSAAPSSFTVEVLNGTDIEGAAAVVSELLSGQGFKVARKGNAEQQVYNETLVVYNTGPRKQLSAGSAEGDGADDPYAAAEDDPYGDDPEGEGAYGEDGDAGDEAGDQDGQSGALPVGGETTPEEGLARAQAVVSALGLGRAIEAGSYYSFDTDVLVIVGYDFKPVN